MKAKKEEWKEKERAAKKLTKEQRQVELAAKFEAMGEEEARALKMQIGVSTRWLL
jgi:hypothetical protein